MNAVMEWRKKNGGDAVRARASTAPVAGTIKLAGNGDGARGEDFHESLEDMPFLTPHDLQASSNVSAGRSRSNSKASIATTMIHIDAHSSPCSSQLSMSPTATTTAANTSTSPSSTPPTSPRKGRHPVSPGQDQSTTPSVSETFERTRALISRMAALNEKMKACLPIRHTPFTPPQPLTSVTSTGEGEGREGVQDSHHPLASEGPEIENHSPSPAVTVIQPLGASTSASGMERRGAVSGPSGSCPAEDERDRVGGLPGLI